MTSISREVITGDGPRKYSSSGATAKKVSFDSIPVIYFSAMFSSDEDENIIDTQRGKIISCTGKAGSVCFMQVNLLHGSAPNLSSSPRALYIATFYVEHSTDLSPKHLPIRFTHELVRGEQTGTVRCSSSTMKLPAAPKGTSFFLSRREQTCDMIRVGDPQE